MVVVCESCSTRFQLDEARIPPKGTLVRCSRCKATFIVRPPSASFEETVQDVVAEVTEAGGAPLPEPAEDLFDKGGDELGDARGRPRDDEAWEFEEGPAEKPPPSLAGGAASPLRAPEPAAHEELGSPEEWDLLGESVASAASEATFVEPEPPAPPPAPAPIAAPAPRVKREPPPRLAPAPSASERGGMLLRAGRTALHGAAWLALAAGVAIGVAAVAPRAPAAFVTEAPRQTIALPGGEARGVHVRLVENAFAGTLAVVQGELSPSGTEPAAAAPAALGLRVHWVDASGARLGAGAWAGPVPAVHALRERAPEALHAAPAAVAGPFAAIFEAIPPEATGVALSLERLPPAPTAQQEAAALVAGEDAAPAATASSPPAPLPSSE